MFRKNKKNKKVEDENMFNFMNKDFIEDEESTNKNKREKKKAKSKKKVHTENKKSKINEKIKSSNEEKRIFEDNTFNADNEIIIGITRIPAPNKSEKRKKKKKQKKNKISVNSNKISPDKNKTSPKKKRRKSKGKRIASAILVTILLVLGVCIIAFLSPTFNINEIYVNGNDRISKEQIISLSRINKGQNIFKLNKKQVAQNIKQNAYVESVEAKRVLPNKIKLDIIERVPTVMLKLENGYAYLNNQGYILEISETPLEKVAIDGYKTKNADIKVGARLCNSDLERLDDALKIFEICKSNDILNLITTINIEDKNNYVLDLEQAMKKVYIGDLSNLTTKILYVKAILQREEGCKGDIFVNMEASKPNPYFRESV